MASPVDTSVKIFNETFPGAPSLAGVAGYCPSLLKACLDTGFGLRAATSLVVSGGVATVTLPAEAKNPNLLDSVILVAGVTGSLVDLNGEQRVINASTTTLKFPTALADGTAAGTITIKTAPAGWAEVYSKTNVSVFAPLSPEASGALLRVDDTGTTSARVRMYESMTDVDSGVNPAPPDVKMSGGYLWWKSYNANATAVPWTLAASDRALYFAPVVYFTVSPELLQAPVYFFGDLKPFASTDAYRAFLTGADRSIQATPFGSVATSTSSGVTGQIARSNTGIGGAVDADWRALSGGVNGTSGEDSSLGVFPAAANNGLFLCEIVVGQRPLTTSGPRGLLPGALYAPQSGMSGGIFVRGTRVPGTGRHSGRVVYALPAGPNLSSAAWDCPLFIDSTGPW